MAETLGQALSYINLCLPNAFASSDIVTLINNEQRKVFKDFTSTNLYSFETVEDQITYTLPSTSFTFDLINDVYCDNSTNAVSSTTIFTPYKYAGDMSEIDGYQYYNQVGSLALNPIPDKSGYHVRVYYQERPYIFTSTETTVQFNLDQDYIDYIKFKVMARIAKSGRTPNVVLGNNYELDAKEVLKKLRLKNAKVKAKQPKKMWSYKEW